MEECRRPYPLPQSGARDALTSRAGSRSLRRPRPPRPDLPLRQAQGVLPSAIRGRPAARQSDRSIAPTRHFDRAQRVEGSHDYGGETSPPHMTGSGQELRAVPVANLHRAELLDLPPVSPLATAAPVLPAIPAPQGAPLDNGQPAAGATAGEKSGEQRPTAVARLPGAGLAEGVGGELRLAALELRTSPCSPRDGPSNRLPNAPWTCGDRMSCARARPLSVPAFRSCHTNGRPRRRGSSAPR